MCGANDDGASDADAPLSRIGCAMASTNLLEDLEAMCCPAGQ